jgi:predicted Zn-dependent protease
MTGIGRAFGLRVATLLTLGAALSGCAGLLGSDQREISLPDTPKISDAQPAVQREHQRILASYGGEYRDAKLEALLNATVTRLVAASERPEQSYRVTILNSPAVNAFALPTGQLYVTRGLLALANDTSEVASVMAHEMAHVIANHASIREDQARQAAIASRVVTEVLSDPQDGALALAKSKIALASFSRGQEFEADGIGVGIAARAGYDPYGAARFLGTLGRNADLKSGVNPDAGSVDFLSTHPATPDRIKNALANARQYVAPGAGDRGRAGYIGSINGIVYGEDPNDGFVRGRRFLHPRLGFTFTAPEGFSLDNTAQAVIGVQSGGARALRLDVVKVPAEQSLPEYLNSGWLEGVDPSSIEETSINGFAAATALARSTQWSYRLYAIRYGTDVYRFIFAAKDNMAEADRSFRDTVNSFRRMSLSEIQGARPLRIKLIRVEPGDTVDRLAARMSFLDKPAERFRLLNGLTPGEQPKPGEQVKIVVD